MRQQRLLVRVFRSAGVKFVSGKIDKLGTTGDECGEYAFGRGTCQVKLLASAPPVLQGPLFACPDSGREAVRSSLFNAAKAFKLASCFSLPIGLSMAPDWSLSATPASPSPRLPPEPSCSAVSHPLHFDTIQSHDGVCPSP